MLLTFRNRHAEVIVFPNKIDPLGIVMELKQSFALLTQTGVRNLF